MGAKTEFFNAMGIFFTRLGGPTHLANSLLIAEMTCTNERKQVELKQIETLFNSLETMQLRKEGILEAVGKIAYTMPMLSPE